MAIVQGSHVWAEFVDEEVKAVVLEVGVGEYKVQEEGTQRAEWVPANKCRSR